MTTPIIEYLCYRCRFCGEVNNYPAFNGLGAQSIFNSLMVEGKIIDSEFGLHKFHQCEPHKGGMSDLIGWIDDGFELENDSE